MPQISKIRIVNCSYNDGNRLIPDELYDLSGDDGSALDSLFNLNNGGGKTVLVQLIMQPIKPRAMAGGRHIEDYFSRQGDHSYVVIEWNKDNSSEKLLTGIAIAASQSVTDDNTRGNSIKYYTFKTEYSNTSPYSITALDLSRNDKGKFVPASFDYVRDLAKSSKGQLEYYASENSAEWSKMLSNFGIFRSEWESVIEALNKDEGGLNQYFDDAKTSEKLISKFFIPAIEQKMRNAASKNGDSSLDTMLINYARKLTERQDEIREREINENLLKELRVLQEDSEQLYNLNDEFSGEIAKTRGFGVALNEKMNGLDRDIKASMKREEELQALIQQIEHERRSSEYYQASEQCEQAKQGYESISAELQLLKETEQHLRHEEELLQCSKLAEEIKDCKSRIAAFADQITKKESESDDAHRISVLKFSLKMCAGEALEQEISRYDCLLVEKAEVDKEYDNTNKAVERARENFDAAMDTYKTAESDLNAEKRQTDRAINQIDISVSRRFDGFYSMVEVESIQQRHMQVKDSAVIMADDISAEIDTLDEEICSIPEEKAECSVKISDKTVEREHIVEAMKEYDELLAQASVIAEKYSVDEYSLFNGRLAEEIQEELDCVKADIGIETKRLDNLLARREAVQKGGLHILPQIMEYVESTGVRFQTGESYLCDLVKEGKIESDRVLEVLNKNPEMAYTLLFDSEKELRRLIEAGNVNWLPAVIPLFTMKQVDEVLKGEKNSVAYLAVFDQSFFADRVAYENELDNSINEAQNLIANRTSHRNEVENDKALLEKFRFPAEYRKGLGEDCDRVDREIKALQAQVRELDAKKESLVNRRENKCEERKKQADFIQQEEHFLTVCESIMSSLQTEKNLYETAQGAWLVKEESESVFRGEQNNLRRVNQRVEKLASDIHDCEKTIEEIQKAIERVSDAEPQEIERDDWRSIQRNYDSLCEAVDKSIAELRRALEKVVGEKEDKEKELQRYNCNPADYEQLVFSTERLWQIKKSRKEHEQSISTKQTEVTESYGQYSKKQAILSEKQEALKEFEGVVLPQSEIGQDFNSRTREAKDLIKKQKVTLHRLENEQNKTDRVLDQVYRELENYQGREGTVEVVLQNEDLSGQWSSIRKVLVGVSKQFNEKHSTLEKNVGNVAREFNGRALSEIVCKLEDIRNMLTDNSVRGDRLFTVHESISAMIESVEKINRKIATDLEEIENDFGDLVNQCMNQGKRIYTDLRKIANSSRVTVVEGKPQKQMVQLSLPEEIELSEEASRVSIKSEIERCAKELKELIEKNVEQKDILKIARNTVSSDRLLHKYIRQNSIQVKVYKIDINSENSSYKIWDDALTQNSGAEKFVIFFSVVLTLMNYTRSSTGIIDKNAKSVLVLDNPFGKITSAHLLKPMFEIARHFNVQLICLSDINKSDVIKCFANVIKLVVKKQPLSNKSIMTHEGNERIEHGFYKVMYGQMSMFS